jgi:SAM-dependent methyltransferase
VADHRSALEECKRVLRPGGRLLAVTNSDTPRALDAVIGAALGAVTGDRRDRWTPTLSFTSENAAAILAPVFDRVEPEEVVTALAVPSADPLLGAVTSISGPVEVYTGMTIDWDAVTRAARPLLEAIIARDGVFRTSIHTTSFLAYA